MMRKFLDIFEIFKNLIKCENIEKNHGNSKVKYIRHSKEAQAICGYFSNNTFHIFADFQKNPSR